MDEKTGQTYALVEDRLDYGTVLDYSDLAEGARLLGAEKLIRALSAIRYGGGHRRPEGHPAAFETLLRELSALERLLRPARRINVTI